MGFLDKLKTGLLKTRQNMVERVEAILQTRRIDESTLEEIEEVLITSDLGADVTDELIRTLREKVGTGEVRSPEDVRA
ncbi:MAG: signal recognition particle receptor subunit alpha, partial [Chloroflexota bacterium]